MELNEYATLVHTLINPPLAPSRRTERNKLWRDAADVVQLLRLTGGRLNEIVRIRLDQFLWTKGKLRLYATKTENVSCHYGIALKRLRKTESGKVSPTGVIISPAKTATFDNSLARAGRKAARLANLNYGRTNGFTCHSLHHTFITDMMEASGNTVALVMSYSGHQSLKSFKIYPHAPTHGCIATDQRIESVGLFLASFAGMEGIEGTPGTLDEKCKPLEKQKIAVS